ncbi:MAG: hypoxanthine phosphoribosyltransferase [Deltaproteobacteria bacterium]|nr:hypoxanthine phosphoribosyltransferase [Deltaproteobacteria bacterium]
MHAADRPISTLLSAEAIGRRVEELGREIRDSYVEKAEREGLGKHELTVVGVLNGSFIFMGDLVRAIDLPLQCDFLGLSSYGSATESSGIVAITKDLSLPIEGRHVLVVEDIIDTGLTMAYLRQNLETRRPASVRVASLLSKPARRKIAVQIDFLGFTIEDRFVVGYGLDFDGRYRNLPYIGALD